MIKLSLVVHSEDYALARLEEISPLDNASKSHFFSLSHLGGEITVACRSDLVPVGSETRRGFRLIEIVGAFALDSVGVLAAVAAPLAAAGVSLFAFSVWSTDAFLVRGDDLARARRALIEAGHSLAEV